MPNYQNGKIYKITSPSTDKIYIGSTTQLLKERFSQHRSRFKKCRKQYSSRHLLKYNDCIIELIEDYPCNSKNELIEREQFYVNLYKQIVINSYNPIADLEKQKIKADLWVKNNKEYIKKRDRQYRLDNIEMYKQKDKIYHEKNRERRNKYSTNYHKWIVSWGGDKRTNNNLLDIKLDLFK